MSSWAEQQPPSFPRPRRVVALLPAHDEEAQIAAALESLAGRLRPPDAVVVAADNCTDRTAEIADAGGAHVVETVGNSGKKAGASDSRSCCPG